jgi:hypothetical protein
METSSPKALVVARVHSLVATKKHGKPSSVETSRALDVPRFHSLSISRTRQTGDQHVPQSGYHNQSSHLDINAVRMIHYISHLERWLWAQVWYPHHWIRWPLGWGAQVGPWHFISANTAECTNKQNMYYKSLGRDSATGVYIFIPGAGISHSFGLISLAKVVWKHSGQGRLEQ